MPVPKSDDQLETETSRQHEQQELEAQVQEMKEAQRLRMEETKERIRARSRKAQPEAETYTVQAGDTLGKIAQELYGDGSRWSEIYEANKDQIADPNVIEIGQVLRIP